MLSLINGDIFQSECDAITNAVNCRGVAGAGIALEFKKRFPHNYKDYLRRCRAKRVHLGEPYLYHGAHPMIVNFPTKDHWDEKTSIKTVQKGFTVIRVNYQLWGIHSLALCAVGAGHGKLFWQDVYMMAQEYLGALPLDVKFYIREKESL